MGFLADVGLFYGNQTLQGGGSVAAGVTPYDRDEIQGMLRLAYN